MKNKKIYIGLIVVIVTIAIIVISYINFEKKEMNFDLDGEYISHLNQFLEIVKNNLEKNDLEYNIEKYKNKEIYSMLLTIYDEQTEYITYNIDLNTNEAIDNEKIVNKFDLSLEDIKNKIEECLKKYYDEEINQGYVDSNECDFDCYKIHRNMDDIESSYVLFVKKDKLYIYMNMALDSVWGDRDYFESLKYNPCVLEI